MTPQGNPSLINCCCDSVGEYKYYCKAEVCDDQMDVCDDPGIYLTPCACQYALDQTWYPNVPCFYFTYGKCCLYICQSPTQIPGENLPSDAIVLQCESDTTNHPLIEEQQALESCEECADPPRFCQALDVGQCETYADGGAECGRESSNPDTCPDTILFEWHAPQYGPCWGAWGSLNGNSCGCEPPGEANYQAPMGGSATLCRRYFGDTPTDTWTTDLPSPCAEDTCITGEGCGWITGNQMSGMVRQAICGTCLLYTSDAADE